MQLYSFAYNGSLDNAFHYHVVRPSFFNNPQTKIGDVMANFPGIVAYGFFISEMLSTFSFDFDFEILADETEGGLPPMLNEEKRKTP